MACWILTGLSWSFTSFVVKVSKEIAGTLTIWKKQKHKKHLFSKKKKKRRRKTHVRDLLIQSSLSGFFGHVRALIHWGTCLEMCNFTKFSVCACVCTSVRLRAHPREKWNTAIAFKKNNVFFFVFVAYPTQNVVKTRIPLDKSVSVAPDFVAYLTCQPCLCKQTAFLHGWAEQSRTRNKVHTQNQSVSTPRKERATLE